MMLRLRIGPIIAKLCFVWNIDIDTSTEEGAQILNNRTEMGQSVNVDLLNPHTQS